MAVTLETDSNIESTRGDKIINLLFVFSLCALNSKLIDFSAVLISCFICDSVAIDC